MEHYENAMDIDEPAAKRRRTPEVVTSSVEGRALEAADRMDAEVGMEFDGEDDEDKVMMVGDAASSAKASASPVAPSVPAPPPPTIPVSTDSLPAAAALSLSGSTAPTDGNATATNGLVPVPALDARGVDGVHHEAFMLANGDASTVYYPVVNGAVGTAADELTASAQDGAPSSVDLTAGSIFANGVNGATSSAGAPPATPRPSSLQTSTFSVPPLPAAPAAEVPPFDATSWKVTHTLRGHQKSLSAVAFSPDGTLLVTCGADKLILLWSFVAASAASSAGHQAVLPTPAFIQSLKGHTAGLNDVAWAPDSRHLASGADDKTVRLWDAATGECRKVLNGHTHHVFCVAYSPHGGLLVSGGWDETIRVWDAKRGTALRTIPAHSESVTSVGFARDGTVFASGSYDGLIRFWDAFSGRCLRTLNADDDNSPVSFVAFTPNAQYLLATTLDSTVRLWDFKTRDGRVVKSYGGHTNIKYCTPTRFITSKDGKCFVVSGSEDGKVWIWDLQTRACIAKLDAHNDAVISVAVHPSLPVFVTVALERDPTAKVFVPA